MFRFTSIVFLQILFGLGSLFAKEFQPKSGGLYALLETDIGVIVVELHYKKAPKTVANFVGLAEGLIPWYDSETDSVTQKPFYDNLVFHRVVRQFMIQTGSQSGSGKDGPGYWFEDEFGKGLRHDRSGVLSMANFGRNRNGSQFFITMSDAQHLNRKHSIFGRVIRGYPIVSKIGWGKLSKSGRPNPPIGLIRIKIVRVGKEAEAFDPLSFEWPTPAKENVRAIVPSGT